MLDSDTNNSDQHLHVEFYIHERKPHSGVTFVRIITPGDKTNVIDRPAKEFDQARFPRQWLAFQMKNGDGSLIGTPISQWAKERPDDLSDYQIAELTILKFQTAEQVATMTDSQVQKVGMGGTGLREKGRAYLTSKNRVASSNQLDEMQSKHDAEMAEMRAQIAELMAKPKVGRPAKTQDA